MAKVQQRILSRASGRGIAAVLAALLLAPAPAPARKFYPDDPLLREPPPVAVAKPNERRVNEYYDFFVNTFGNPGEADRRQEDAPPPPSKAVNTLGEAPDSAWYTNRIGSRPMSIEEIVRGPGNSNAPATDKPWVVTSGKAEGITPGFVMTDSKGRRYFVKFDPRRNPEMASAADVIGTKAFHALGYNTPENYIIRFKRAQLAVGEKATVTDELGIDRPMKPEDIDYALRRMPRDGEGYYRALASLSVPGHPIGAFRYYGTRSDDPNDIVPHEDRRDLRGLYVFAAWLNHTDSKALNSLDTVVEENGVRFIKHYLIDFGAILGSDSFEAKSPRAGNVYLFDFKPAAWQFLTLGLYAPKWMRLDFPDIPEAGRLHYEAFDPENWKNNYPNPAFEARTPGDLYWAAKKVMAFSDEAIRALAGTGEYSDPEAAAWIAKCLIERRDRIGRAFFERVLPLDNFAVAGGKLVFEDLAVKHGFRGPRQLTVAWSEFDNEAEVKRPIPRAVSFEVPRSPAPYLAADISSGDPAKTVTVYLRDGRVVGIDRAW